MYFRRIQLFGEDNIYLVRYDCFTGKTAVTENYKYYSNTETDKADEKLTARNSVYYYNLSVENYPYCIN